MHLNFLIFLSFLISSVSITFAEIAFCNYNDRAILFKTKINGYVCDLEFDRIAGNVTEISGNHVINSKSNKDVEILSIDPIYSAQITVFSSTFCKTFNNLEVIDMNESQISEIDESSLNDCKKLKILQFYKNKISEIPGNIFKTNENIEELYITFNEIRNFPENVFANQKKLKILDLKYNFIESFQESVFSALIELKELNLEANNISRLNKNWFQNLKNLEILNLNYNKITELPKRVFNNLLNLKELLIKSNNLKIINCNAFGEIMRNSGIEKFELQNNQIYAIDRKIIENNSHIVISIHKNNCSIDPLTNKSHKVQKLKDCLKNYGKYEIIDSLYHCKLIPI